LLLGLGPVAFGLIAMLLAPLALTWTGRPWLGLTLVAGAALFWWAVLLVARHALTPRLAVVGPIVVLLAVALARPIAHDPLSFLTARPSWGGDVETPRSAAFMLDRESALVATQKLTVVLLLAGPLAAAVGLAPWTRRWFTLAMLAGAAALLVMTMLQMERSKSGPADPLDRANLAMFTPMPAQHVAATLAGLAAWLVAVMLASIRQWRQDRPDDRQPAAPDAAHAGGIADPTWRCPSHNEDRASAVPHLLIAVLAAVVLAGTTAARTAMSR